MNERQTVKHLIRGATTATLATALVGAEGWPYASLVQVATDDAGAPLLLISTLAEHTKNIAADARVSLLFDGTAGLSEPLTGPRASLQGRAVVTSHHRDRERFLARHPGAAMYAGFADFAFYRIAATRAHLVAGFGRISWIEAADILLPADLAATVAALEAPVLAHMNADHADAIRLYAERLLGVAGDGASLIGFDADGCDIRAAGRVHRLPFDRPVHDAASARSTLAELAVRARSG